MQITNLPNKIKLNNGQPAIVKTQNPFYINNTKVDAISFSGKSEKFESNLSIDVAKVVSGGVAGGTSGYRGAFKPVEGENKPFDKAVVETLTQSICAYNAEQYAKSKENPNPHDKTDYSKVIVGGDTRLATRKFSPMIKQQLMNNGFDVYYAKGSLWQGIKDFFVTWKLSSLTHPAKEIPTPMHALAARELQTGTSILLTASHNPWNYGGYNFITADAAIAPDHITKQLADGVEKLAAKEELKASIKEEKGKLHSFDPYEMYSKHLDKNMNIDWQAIKNANIFIGYDSVGGTGEKYFPRLLKDHDIKLNAKFNTDAEGPNPVEKNLKDLTEALKKSDAELKIGLANDGDADRFGILDENGKIINPNDVILLTAYHLIKNKGLDEGVIFRNQATSSVIDVLAEKYCGDKVKVEQTPVGFKYSAEGIIENEEKGVPTILAAEESGGLTIHNNIPEKDGFIALITMLELVAAEKKPIGQILSEIKAELPIKFQQERLDLKFKNDEDKNAIVNEFAKYTTGEKTEFAGFPIDVEKTQQVAEEIKTLKKNGDGFKIYLEDGSAILARKSGTEPVVRVNLEIRGETEETAKEKFDSIKHAAKALSKEFNAINSDH